MTAKFFSDLDYMRTLKKRIVCYFTHKNRFCTFDYNNVWKLPDIERKQKKCAEFFENRKSFEKLFLKRSPKLSYRFPSYKVSSKFSNLKKGAQFFASAHSRHIPMTRHDLNTNIRHEKKTMANKLKIYS